MSNCKNCIHNEICNKKINERIKCTSFSKSTDYVKLKNNDFKKLIDDLIDSLSNYQAENEKLINDNRSLEFEIRKLKSIINNNVVSKEAIGITD